jgi:signal transduction histidine kinase
MLRVSRERIVLERFIMPALPSIPAEAGPPRGDSPLPFSEAARLRDEFLLLASHELMTPLTSLKLQVQTIKLMSEREPETAPPWAPSLLDVCDRQIGRLSRLFDDVLQAIQIQADELEPALEEIDLAALVREVVARAVRQGAKAGCMITIDADEGTIGRWDRGQIERLVFHLIKNAVTFGEHRPVEVEVRATGEGARLTVRDHGCGIAPEHHARIFERFERAAPVEHFGGLGLGLYIARAVVRAYHGSIRVESEPGRGATFIVELPLAPEGDGAAPRSPGVPRQEAVSASARPADLDSR